MNIDIRFLPSPLNRDSLSNRAVVVIDVLRATSVMVHALSEGAMEVIPVATVEEALQRVKTFASGSALLGGERGSRKIEGFDLGNSPKEYIADRVRGKRLILTTTNGTKAFHLVSPGKEIMVGSFFNIGATARRCLELDKDLLIFPSGDRGEFSLEDTVCGGMLIDLILKGEKETFTPYNPESPGLQTGDESNFESNDKEEPLPLGRGCTGFTLTDASYTALILYQRFKDNLSEAFYLSSHGRELADLGLGDDLLYCARTNVTNIVPIFKDGAIK